VTSLPLREPQWRRPGPGRRTGGARPGAHAPVLELQRMAGNRAVNALLARDPKTKAPPPKKQDPPKHNHVVIEGMAPILVESAQIGQVRPRIGSDRGAEREKPAPQVSEITVTSLLGDHSTELFQKSLWGKPFSAEIVFVKPDGQVYLRIKLKNALISSYSVSGHGGSPDAKPMESWTLNAESIEYETSGGGAADTAD
jgi:type VI protein secretion system component Hcp